MSEPSHEFTHVDREGKAKMVSVAEKEKTRRTARARARVLMQPETLAAIREGKVAKGAVLGTARLAGIMGAKKTSDLIPLCHPLEIVAVGVDFAFADDRTIEVTSEVTAVDRTGVEMEALTAASVAALTIYDMCKAVDRGMEIRELVLTFKSGGKSGEYRRD